MREKRQDIGVVRVKRERLAERRFRVGEPPLSNVDRAKVGMNARVIRRQSLRFAQARFGRGKIAGLQLAKRTIHPLGGVTPRYPVTLLVAPAAAAWAQRIAPGQSTPTLAASLAN